MEWLLSIFHGEVEHTVTSMERNGISYAAIPKTSKQNCSALHGVNPNLLKK